MTEHHLRIYDHHPNVPQPNGSVTFEAPDGASEEQIIEQIRREFVNPFRCADVVWKDGQINGGWAVLYQDHRGIQLRLGVDEARAQHLWSAVCVVYDLLAEDGIVEPFGGETSERVIPATLEYIWRCANAQTRMHQMVEDGSWSGR